MSERGGEPGEFEGGKRRSFEARRRARRIRRVLLVLAALVVVSIASVAAYTFSKTFSSSAEVRPNPPVESTSETTKQSKSSGSTGGGRTDPASTPPPKKSCDGFRVLVDRNNPLPSTYAPQDLGSLLAGNVPTTGEDMLLRAGAIPPLARMSVNAAADGEELVVISAYRSYADQRSTFAYYSSIYGPGDVEMVSAPPGQSQHQLGTTVDFSNAQVGYELLPAFGDTSASRWLEKKAWKYGYVNTYPEGEESGTGRQYESWEYRYVGPDTAREIHDKKISLRIFLKDEGFPPRC